MNALWKIWAVIFAVVVLWGAAILTGMIESPQWFEDLVRQFGPQLGN